MCQPTSLSPTEHVQNRPQALHVRSVYTRDVREDEPLRVPMGGNETLIVCFFISLFRAAMPLPVVLVSARFH